MRSGRLGFLAAIALCGCGARSTLDPEAAGGPHTGTTDGAGGAGGSPCPGGLVVTGAEIATPGLPTTEPNPGDQRLPHFARLFADQPDLALAFGVPTLDTSAVVIGDTTFTPWGSWPPPVAPATPISPHRSTAFAVAAGQGGTYSMLFDVEDLGACATCEFGTAFEAAVAPTATLGASMLIDPAANRAAFVQTMGESHVLGFMRSDASGATSLSLRMVDGTGVTSSADGVACGSSPLVADAVAVQDRFLVATSTSLAKGGCAGAADDPVAIEVLDATASAVAWPSVIGFITGLGTGSVKQLALSPRSDGAWLVAQLTGQDKTTGAIQVVRLDVHGAQVAEPFDAVGPGRSDFAVAPLGDGFALAWLEPTESEPNLGVRFIDASGAKVGSTIVPPLPMTSPLEPLALASKAGAMEVVLGWGLRQLDVAKSDPATIHLLRVGCGGGG